MNSPKLRTETAKLDALVGLPPPPPFGERMYAISFDLDTDTLQQVYPGDSWRNAYSEMRKILIEEGFNWTQGSVYFGGERINAVTCVLVAQRLARELSWFSASVRDIRMLRIEDNNELGPAIGAANLEPSWTSSSRRLVELERLSPRSTWGTQHLVATNREPPERWHWRAGVRPDDRWGLRGRTTRESNLTEMAEDDQLQRIFSLLDVLSVQAGATHAGVDALREETRNGFERVERRLGNVETRLEGVERRLGNVETRVEGVETELRAFRNETNRRVSSLEERSH